MADQEDGTSPCVPDQTLQEMETELLRVYREGDPALVAATIRMLQRALSGMPVARARAAREREACALRGGHGA
ncbi:conserved protein of unknown function [Rhodovastum atsumiense]|uniref:Uncharacterized protein n=1 Tax=Rhodovastum atsumiense TaxID=504468 RepID=A0A5M6IK83_9PROT|nr:hypothetical protein [Rhodovastum atsumiense]KAA5608279.1 hypothetical protein F1189_29770 [Rhodovastum atsumiense]CAH2602590.1 conserved protein of unknown function [Rhodovastum atsumiense]